MLRVRPGRVIVATGAAERPSLFEGNDLPGVMLGRGALRLARLYGVRPGLRAVVYTDDDRGWRTAAELVAAGVHVAAVVDQRPAPNPDAGDRVASAGVEVLLGARVLKAQGSGALAGVTIETPDEPRTISCDLLVVANRLEPVLSLLAQNGLRPAYDTGLGEFVPGDSVPGVGVAGDVRGPAAADLVLEDGSLAGLEAAQALGFAGDAPAPDRAAWEARRVAFLAARPTVDPTRSPTSGKQFVCVCEDVTTKDIKHAIAEGFDSLETLKRYTTVTMGPCQGKMCHGLAARLHASLTGQTPADTGLTTSRPPYQPVQLGILAGPHLSPVRRTAMHSRHAALNPTWMDMGEWKRPLVYTSIEAETRAVHEAVGLIDVSTLGKLDVRGVDAGDFLDWLHPNRFSDLRVGRVRYRVMLDDAGIILDDGTVARLSDDRFLLTTTTGNIEAIDQWLKWWLAGTDRDVQVTNVTSELAALNLAGPRARDLLAKLTELDVSKETVPYLAAIEGTVAGVPAIVLRIGFVGELGFEMHFPADYGDFLWDAIMEAGKEFEVQPFGVEAQRVLRLEKQHAIVGQDTDALSQPYEAGMAWLVKAEKPDFIGRDALAAFVQEGEQQALVGFETDGRIVPHEGEAITRHGEPVGRVTSAKWSPYLSKTIGMGWVPVEDAKEGATITIRHVGEPLPATVRLKAFYDPEGLRLRS
jgi:sarcosine oxidase subunit alpha